MMWLGMRPAGTAESNSLHAETLRTNPDADAERGSEGDPHLRSRNEIAGYDVFAADGHIGHVQGLLLDEKGWAIRFIVVNTSNWWLGHAVLIAPRWITNVRWEERTVKMSLTRDAVKASPPYSPGSRMGRAEEARIYEHYEKPAYWAREVQLQNPEFRLP
jgi:hypothetical protein